jgi:sugar (glycoside-pentoside-hexuronide) transporter
VQDIHDDAPAGRLPLRVKLGYGGAESAGSLIWTVFYTYFLFYLTDVAKMDPGMAGVVLMAGSIWQAVFTPLAGVFSDTRTWKWGRRRPFLLAVAAPYGVISWLLFTDLGLSSTWTAVYVLATVVLYFTAYVLIDVPYTALAAEMTQDYDERTSLVTYRTAWSQVMTIIGAAAPLALAGALASRLGSERAGWSVMAAVLGVAAAVPVLLTWRVTRGYELFPAKTRVAWRDVFGDALRNRSFRYTMGIYAAGYTAINLLMAVAVYFLTYVMHYGDNMTSLALFVYVVAGTAWLPLINVVTRRWGKRFALAAFMVLWAVAMVAMLFVGPHTVILFWALILISPAGAVAATMLSWAMIPDCTEVDEFKTGQRREGLYYGIATFAQQTAVAMALLFTGIFLSWIGYVPDVPQSHGTLLGIRLLFALGTALFAIVTLVLAIRLPLTREKHAALRAALRSRELGHEPTTEGFADVL